MTMFYIRPVVREDEPFLWEMLYESIFTPEGQDPSNKDIIKSPNLSKYVEDWGRDGDMGFIAVNAAGESIGSVTMRLFDEHNKGYGYVDNRTPELGLAMVREYRGMGMGTQLLNRMMDEAKDHGIPSISLSVDPNNPAIHLYKRCGFIEVGMVGTSVTMRVLLI